MPGARGVHGWDSVYDLLKHNEGCGRQRDDDGGCLHDDVEGYYLVNTTTHSRARTVEAMDAGVMMMEVRR